LKKIPDNENNLISAKLLHTFAMELTKFITLQLENYLSIELANGKDPSMTTDVGPYSLICPFFGLVK
jgi:hypothetical protein